ncbi:unnamed protein product [Allacma fusca]|uniref:Uncharacterized protein n=1 Tax=Allacma fusca TaxID=39272 RepID=A0A8J2NTC5_9HEXA|nr:unnamed protein product [Allacma fusca]
MQRVEAQSIYQPPDEFNVWMLAMVGVGSAFIIFVIASIYLMCNSPTGNQPQPLMRRSSQPTKTIRNTIPTTERNQL